MGRRAAIIRPSRLDAFMRSRSLDAAPPARMRWEPKEHRRPPRKFFRCLCIIIPAASFAGVYYSFALTTALTPLQNYEPPPPLPEASPPPPAGPPPIAFILTSFQDGAVLGDGLRLLVSADALHWSTLPGAPVSLPLSQLRPLDVRVFRDPSIVWHGGHFHLVFTSHLCADQVYGHWQCRRHTKPRPVLRFGYSRSRDLVNWEGTRLIEMPVKDGCSLWAPEATLLPNGGGLMVVFTVTIASGLCPHTMRESDHVPYYTISKDFRHFERPLPLHVNKGESIIDMYPVLLGGPLLDESSDPSSFERRNQPQLPHRLVYKAESNLCGHPYAAPLEWPYRKALYTNASCSLVLRIARSASPFGPWIPDTSTSGAFFPDAISRPCVEGPTVLKEPNGSWLILFDSYRTDCLLTAPPEGLAPHGYLPECGIVAGRPAEDAGMRRLPSQERHGRCAYEPSRRGFGAMRSEDLATWVDVSGEVSSPPEHKHGTALRLPKEAWAAVCEEAASNGSPFESICRERHERTG